MNEPTKIAPHAPLHFCPMSMGRPDVVTIEQAFSDDELAGIEGACLQLPLERTVVGPEGDIRHNRLDVYRAALANGPETLWLFLKLMTNLQKANMQLRVAIWGIAECAQYSVYNEGRHCWHVDSAMPEDGVVHMPRKLSFELLLSPPGEYEGGAREFLGGLGKRMASRARGTLIVFPSCVLTRVDNVTRGTRRSLDGWVSGPEFK